MMQLYEYELKWKPAKHFSDLSRLVIKLTV